MIMLVVKTTTELLVVIENSENGTNRCLKVSGKIQQMLLRNVDANYYNRIRETLALYAKM